MTDPNATTGPTWMPPAPPRRPGWMIPSLVGAVVLVLALAGVAIWALLRPVSGSPTPTPTRAAALGTQAPDPPPAVTSYTPTKLDFVLKVKITRKKCFGSAGCNITYHIDLTYTGAPLNDSDTWQITYEVSGVEDGPAVNTLELTGDQYSYDESETAETASSSTKLKVKVTDVEEK